MKALKRVALTLGILLGVVLLAAAGLFLYLTATEYRPEPEETLALAGPELTPLDKSSFTILSWNIGYCALGEESDFFMDGGREVRPASAELIQKNLDGIQNFLSGQDADFLLLQEVDAGSRRSYDLDELAVLREEQSRASAYALNFSTKFVPYPWPPIGKVRSGLLTSSRYQIRNATRVSLPCPFSWPVSMVNLKRCLLVSRIPVAGTEKELVLVNLHLEAYDDGEGKLAQSKQLRTLLAEEYEKGNYVVAGGDWNQVFPDAEAVWPNTHKALWSPGYLDESELDDGWHYVWDSTVPSCRLLNQPYDPADRKNTQYYVIDGFLVSPNLMVEQVETLDAGFACSDHNPVRLTLHLED
ncbi:MAG: endonuclease/exonuclease/phosphatase family protein [Oscillospiraceae bacterium]|nr:endonuclease/exonuclease/phosphatase family protein [Oscillospiraceae bacterium]